MPPPLHSGIQKFAICKLLVLQKSVCFFVKHRGAGVEVTGSGLLRLTPRVSVRTYQGEVRGSAVKMQSIITGSSHTAVQLPAWGKHSVILDPLKSPNLLFSRALYCELSSSPRAVFRSKQSLWAKT